MKTKYTVCKCKNCGLVFVSPTPSWEELSQYYFRLDEISSSPPVSRLRRLIKRPQAVVKDWKELIFLNEHLDDFKPLDTLKVFCESVRKSGKRLRNDYFVI